VNEEILEKICDYAEIREGERILEIGAGSGNLTKKILEKEAFVYALEKDPLLVIKLKQRFSNQYEDQMKIIEGDALKIPFPKFDKVVSSLPFSISRKITERLLMEKFNVGILVYQREFAKKLIAKENSREYKFISALTQSCCSEVKILDKISPNAFEPSPQVVSSIVKLSQKFKVEKSFIEFLHRLFDHRNKKVRNSLKREQQDIPKNFADKRPFELSPEELRGLYDEILHLRR
jgi:16S rRNA (adenine1518-N6/adenine1519-N6)-dimethyltransferase